jgi:hypothetical protein
MSRNKIVPTPDTCRKIIRQRRQALCRSARADYDSSDPVTRWLINTLWVVSSVDRANGRKPFSHLGMA